MVIIGAKRKHVLVHLSVVFFKYVCAHVGGGDSDGGGMVVWVMGEGWWCGCWGRDGVGDGGRGWGCE